jgi:hypothetical protein
VCGNLVNPARRSCGPQSALVLKYGGMTSGSFASDRLRLTRGWFFGLKFGSEMLYSNQRNGILILMNHRGHPTISAHPPPIVVFPIASETLTG